MAPTTHSPALRALLALASLAPIALAALTLDERGEVARAEGCSGAPAHTCTFHEWQKATLERPSVDVPTDAVIHIQLSSETDCPPYPSQPGGLQPGAGGAVGSPVIRVTDPSGNEVAFERYSTGDSLPTSRQVTGSATAKAIARLMLSPKSPLSPYTTYSIELSNLPSTQSLAFSTGPGPTPPPSVAVTVTKSRQVETVEHVCCRVECHNTCQCTSFVMADCSPLVEGELDRLTPSVQLSVVPYAEADTVGDIEHTYPDGRVARESFPPVWYQLIGQAGLHCYVGVATNRATGQTTRSEPTCVVFDDTISKKTLCESAGAYLEHCKSQARGPIFGPDPAGVEQYRARCGQGGGEGIGNASGGDGSPPSSEDVSANPGANPPPPSSPAPRSSAHDTSCSYRSFSASSSPGAFLLLLVGAIFARSKSPSRQ